jgi:hypothetical protein
MAAVNSCGKYHIVLKDEIEINFDDGLHERFDFPPVLEEEFAEFPKNNNNQHHSSRFESQIEELLMRLVLGTSLPKFNGDVRFWPSFLVIYGRQTHSVNSTKEQQEDVVDRRC